MSWKIAPYPLVGNNKGRKTNTHTHTHTHTNTHTQLDLDSYCEWDLLCSVLKLMSQALKETKRRREKNTSALNWSKTIPKNALQSIYWVCFFGKKCYRVLKMHESFSDFQVWYKKLREYSRKKWASNLNMTYCVEANRLPRLLMSMA